MSSFTRAVRRGNDPDAVHDMRVASRRLRAALSVFEGAFDAPGYAKLQREIRLVTGALSRARDLDVMIGALQKDAAALPGSHRGAVGDLIRELSADRRNAQGEVVAALDRLAKFDPAAAFAGLRATASDDEAGNVAGAQGGSDGEP
jgi:CHAD domain-containing protein